MNSPTHRTLSKFAVLALLAAASAAQAQTVAYWRFETGPANTDVLHSLPDGAFEANILDVSGNGNHLSAWRTGECCGYNYRADVSDTTIPGTGLPNTLSVKNTGCCPGMFTSSADSLPSGVDIETMTPAAFTIEASFKPESGGYRTVVGRDAVGVAEDGALAAVYLQVRPNNAMTFVFVDVAGFAHTAESKPDLISGFDYPTDNDGLTGTWYNVAAVSDGTTMSLYVNNVLVASTDISDSPDTSLAHGDQSGGDWHAGGWSVGRGLFNGGHTDRAYGFIDEVRISNVALTPDQFLFADTSCPADFDGDGFITGIDYDLYVAAFEAGETSADFDGDGFITGIDFDFYVIAFEAGC